MISLRKNDLGDSCTLFDLDFVVDFEQAHRLDAHP